MPDPRSVLKEFRSLDQKRRSHGLSGEEEARFLQLCDIIGPEPAPQPKPGFDVNNAAAELRASLEPAGLHRRSQPVAPPEPEPESPSAMESAPDPMGEYPAFDEGGIVAPFEPAADLGAAPAEPSGYETPSAGLGWNDQSAFASPEQPFDGQEAAEPAFAASAGFEPDPYTPAADQVGAFFEAPPAEQVDIDSEWEIGQGDVLEPIFSETTPDAAENLLPNGPGSWEQGSAEVVPEFELAASGSFGVAPAAPTDGEPLAEGFADPSTLEGNAPFSSEPLADENAEWAAPAAEQPVEAGEWAEQSGEEVSGDVRSWEGLPSDTYQQPEGYGDAAYPVTPAASADELDWGSVNDGEAGIAATQDAGVPQEVLTEWSAEQTPFQEEDGANWSAQQKPQAAEWAALAEQEPREEDVSNWSAEQEPALAEQSLPAEQMMTEETPAHVADPLEWLEVDTPDQEGAGASSLPEPPDRTTEPHAAFSIEQTDKWAVGPHASDTVHDESSVPNLPDQLSEGDPGGVELVSAAGFLSEAAAAQDDDVLAAGSPMVIPDADPHAPTLELTEEDAIEPVEGEIIEELASSESLDSPGPMPDHGGQSRTFVQGSHRVVIHTFDGLIKRGTLTDVDLDAEEVPVSTDPSAPLESISTETIKAIFFMLPPGEKPIATSGKRVRVTFGDGRQVAGFSDDYRPEDVGFFMIPADTRTNTARIWVYREATSQIVVT